MKIDEERLVKSIGVLVNGRLEEEGSSWKHNNIDHLDKERRAFQNERFLAAWVLLSRCSQTTLQETWKDYRESLFDFAKRLLSEEGITDESEQRLLICYVRLLSQVVSRLVFSVEARDLLHMILDTWAFVSSNWKLDDMSHRRMNIDVADALFVMIPEEKDVTRISKALNTLWSVFSQRGIEKWSMKPPGKGEGNDQQSMTEEFRKVIALLDSILTTDETGTVDNEEYIKDTWLKLVLIIFDIQEAAISDELANKVMQWVSQHDQKLSKELRFGWHEWMMRYIAVRCSQSRSFLALRDPSLMTNLQNILLAHAVSPDDGAHRATSWRTASAVVNKIGWKWGASSSVNSPICIWARLASGEWRLQLEKGKKLSLQDQAVLDECGHMMISVVRFLVNFDANPADPKTLDAEALLHTKESVEESFLAASEYLASPPPLNFQPIVAEVWCELLPELDLDMIGSLETVVPALTNLLERFTEKCPEDAILRSLTHVQSTAAHNDRFRNLIRPLEEPIALCIRELTTQSPGPSLFSPTPDIDGSIQFPDTSTDCGPFETAHEEFSELNQEEYALPIEDTVRSRESVKEKWALRRKQSDDPMNIPSDYSVLNKKEEYSGTRAIPPLCVLLRRSWHDAMRSFTLRNMQRSKQQGMFGVSGGNTKKIDYKKTFPSVLSILQTSALNHQIETMKGEDDKALSLYPAEFDFKTTIDRMAESRSRAFLLLDFSSIVQAHTTWRKKMPRKGVQLAYSIRHNANPKLLQLFTRLGVALRVATKYDLQLVRNSKHDKLLLWEDFHVAEKPPSFYRALFDNQDAPEKNIPVTINTAFDLERIESQGKVVSNRRHQAAPRLQFLVKLDNSALPDWPSLLKNLCMKAAAAGNDIVGFAVELVTEVSRLKTLLNAITALIDFVTSEGIMRTIQVHMTLAPASAVIDDTIIEWSRSQSTKCALISIDVSRLLLANAAALCARIIGVKKTGFHAHYYIDDGCYGSLSHYSKDGAPIPLRLRSDPTDEFQNESDIQLTSTVWGPTCDGLDKVCSDVTLPILSRDDWLVFSDFGFCNEGTCFNGLSPPDIACCILGKI
ncbi:pyridoxal-dependent decarboxylase [Nitzschia inconspicua]|uniref:Pyridoxal-dependent decarboxylase n=1 Tax=Nitzschia inconspicua TaxID=303405 RepID=A0A9K3KKY7_9STRA|nr:pyridoxal-dependent decarboxylase [Nitzschia inconspicua]